MCGSTDVAKNVYEVDQKLGGGELCLSACPGVGNRPPRKENIANPRGCAREGGAMVTVKIADTDKQHIMARRERAPLCHTNLSVIKLK